MGLEIVNYSFHPVTEYVKTLGITELDEDVNENLKLLFEFKHTPTHYEIRDRCQKIVQHAIENDHRAVFIRNYETFQSYLIQEFQKNEIRVFIPYYYSYKYTESIVGYDLLNHIAYLSINDIIELPIQSNPPFIMKSLDLQGNETSYELIMNGAINGVDNISYTIKNGPLSQNIDWILSFGDLIRIKPITEVFRLKFGLHIIDQDLVIEHLKSIIEKISLIKENQNVDGNDLINSQLTQLTDVLNAIKIVDTLEIQLYLSLTHSANLEFKKKGNKEIELLIRAENLYNDMDEAFQKIIQNFDTEEFKKLGIIRDYPLTHNPATLYNSLGLYYLLNNNYLRAKIYLQKSLQEYNNYNSIDIEDGAIHHLNINLIQTKIVLYELSEAEDDINTLLNSIDPLELHRIVPLKIQLSSIFQKRGDFSRSINLYSMILEEIRDDANLSNFEVAIQIHNAINYHLIKDRIRALEVLSDVISNNPDNYHLSSKAAYVHSLIQFSDGKSINAGMVELLEEYNDEHNILYAQLELIKILKLISNNDTKNNGIDQLVSYCSHHPERSIYGLKILGINYIKQSKYG